MILARKLIFEQRNEGFGRYLGSSIAINPGHIWRIAKDDYDKKKKENNNINNNSDNDVRY